MTKSTLICFLALAVLSITSCAEEDPNDMTGMQGGNNNNNNNNPPATVGESAPSFSLSSSSGGSVSLADFEGKPLVIFFFGSSCPNCIASAPAVESDLFQAYSSDVVSLIGIDTWDGNLAAVDNFQSTTGVTFDLLLNGSNVESNYGITYDRLVIVDADGILAFKGSTAARSNIDDVKEALNEMLE